MTLPGVMLTVVERSRTDAGITDDVDHDEQGRRSSERVVGSVMAEWVRNRAARVTIRGRCERLTKRTPSAVPDARLVLLCIALLCRALQCADPARTKGQWCKNSNPPSDTDRACQVERVIMHHRRCCCRGKGGAHLRYTDVIFTKSACMLWL